MKKIMTLAIIALASVAMVSCCGQPKKKADACCCDCKAKTECCEKKAECCEKKAECTKADCAGCEKKADCPKAAECPQAAPAN